MSTGIHPAITTTDPKAMPGRSFLRQGAHTLFYKVVSLVVVFASGVLTARWLGPAGKGVLSVYFAVIAMVVPLAELGIRQSVAYMAGQRLHPEAGIFAAMRGLYLLSSLLCVAALAAIYHGLGFTDRYGMFLTLAFLAIVPLSLYESYSSGLFIARKDVEKINHLAFIDKASALLLIFVAVVVLDGGVLGAALAYLLSRVINFTLVNYWLREHLLVRPRLSRPVIREMLGKGFMFAFALFVIQLNYKLSMLLLEKLADAYSVGIYSVGVTFAEMLKEVPLALGLVLFARSANWSGPDIGQALQKAAMLSRVVFAAMLVLAAILAGVAAYCIPLFYGSDFSESVRVTWLLLPGIVLLSVFLILNLFLAGQGKPWVSIVAFGPALALNVALNVISIPAYGVAGAAASATVSYAFATLVFVAIFLRMYGLRASEVLLPRLSDLRHLRDRLQGRTA